MGAAVLLEASTTHGISPAAAWRTPPAGPPPPCSNPHHARDLPQGLHIDSERLLASLIGLDTRTKQWLKDRTPIRMRSDSCASTSHRSCVGDVSADAVARKHQAAEVVAARRRRVARNRPCLVGLEGEAHQGEEQGDVGVHFEAYRHPSRFGHHPDRGGAPEVILETVNGTRCEVQVDIVIRMEVHDLALRRTQRPPCAAARPGLREVRPARQLRHGTRGQRHAPIMTSSPSVHQDLSKP